VYLNCYRFNTQEKNRNRQRDAKIRKDRQSGLRDTKGKKTHTTRQNSYKPNESGTNTKLNIRKKLILNHKAFRSDFEIIS